jgi:peptidoglycan/LPS O-acetylase OafA/YrhL
MEGQASLLSYLLIACGLTSTLVVQEGLVHRWLNSRVLVWIGTVSYSVYIWQQLFTRRPAPDVSPMGWAGRLPINLLLTFAVAAASYYFFERPVQRWGKRLAARRQEAATGADLPQIYKRRLISG